MKIGLFGGSFDPPHIAHLIIAERVKEELLLDKVIFIPTNIPSHKEKPVASAYDRLMMLKFCTEENPYFAVSTIEIEREGISFTIDTVKQMKKIYQQDELFLIIGEDEAKNFLTWREPENILHYCKVVVITRPQSKGVLPDLLKDAIKIEENIDISSTKIREYVKQGKSIKYLVISQVEQYIKNRNLYK